MTFHEAKQWGIRPSELMDIEDTYVAFCFDQAVSLYANSVIQELEKITGKNAEKLKLEKLKVILRGMEDKDGNFITDLRTINKESSFRDPSTMSTASKSTKDEKTG
jgi:hypothetical protein